MQSHKLYCAWAALIIGILLVTFLTLYFAVLKPKDPETFPQPVTLSRIEFSVFPSLKLNITLGLVVTVKNRNYGSFEYKNTTAYVSYRGGVVAQAPIVGDRIPARGKLNVSSSVDILADRLIINPLFWIDLNVGSFNFSSLTTLKGKVNAFNSLKMKATAQSRCNISVFVQSQTAVSTCYNKFKM